MVFEGQEKATLMFIFLQNFFPFEVFFAIQTRWIPQVGGSIFGDSIAATANLRKLVGILGILGEGSGFVAHLIIENIKRKGQNWPPTLFHFIGFK